MSQHVEVAIEAARVTRDKIRAKFMSEPTLAESVTLHAQDKTANRIDLVADDWCTEILRDKGVQVVSEEQQRDAIPEVDGEVWAIIDPLDGSDLLEMGIPLWCCAVTIIKPFKQEITAAAVAVASSDAVYYADESGAKVWRNPNQKLDSPKDIVVDTLRARGQDRLSNATVTVYAQKPRNMLSLIDSSFLKTLRRLQRADEKNRKAGKRRSAFRIHTYAGNPALVRMVDRQIDPEVCRGIDAVFDVAGQLPHDVVPGAYIALQAGATMYDLESGAKVTVDELTKYVLSPQKHIYYVIASEASLAREIRNILVKSYRENKRQWKRTQLQIGGGIQADVQWGDTFRNCEIMDIGVRGACIEFRGENGANWTLPAIGDAIRVTLLGAAYSATVRWAEDQSFGVEFPEEASISGPLPATSNRQL